MKARVLITMIRELVTCYNNNIQNDYQWRVGKICNINDMWFVPIKAVKCVNYEAQRDDSFDLIRKNEVYPVIIEIDDETPKSFLNPKKYLIINRNGHKQYWTSKDFETIEYLKKE